MLLAKRVQSRVTNWKPIIEGKERKGKERKGKERKGKECGNTAVSFMLPSMSLLLHLGSDLFQYEFIRDIGGRK